jgi:lysozyme family protein
MLDKKIFEHTLSVEGGYVDDKYDTGGKTKYGISQKAYPDLDIKNLTLETASGIYYRDYWLASRCDELHVTLAICVFDASVNMGVGRSIRLLQEVLNVTQDGVFGKITMGALREKDQVTLAGEFTQKRIETYATFKQFSRYGKGWVSRTNKTYIFAIEMGNGPFIKLTDSKEELKNETSDFLLKDEKEINPIIASSADKTKLSLSIKGAIIIIVGTLLNHYGVEVEQETIQTIIDTIENIIVCRWFNHCVTRIVEKDSKYS